MGLLDIFKRRPRPVPKHVPAPGEPRTLVLYHFETCPFCMRVRRSMRKLSIEAEMRNTKRDPSASAELAALTGKTQVPCLVIDGQPLLESADIVAWLEAHAA